MSANILEIGHIACKLTDKCDNSRTPSSLSLQCPWLHRMRLARGTKRPNSTGLDWSGVEWTALDWAGTVQLGVQQQQQQQRLQIKNRMQSRNVVDAATKSGYNEGLSHPTPRSMAPGPTWRAEVGSEGAPKPKPLKPFNVTFKTRLGKYVTMVSLCMPVCTRVYVCVHVVGACIIAACCMCACVCVCVWSF